MKRIFILLNLVIFASANSCFAAGMVFDPSEYKAYDSVQTTNISNSKIENEIRSSMRIAQDSVSGQSENFNNALFELDSAQVNIRNELLDYKAKYQEVDTQYQLIKEQRRVLAEQIKNVEKRIKAIERSKSNIRKTMI